MGKNIETHPYLFQYHCLDYTATVACVTRGLQYVLEEGILPECYSGSFLKAAKLFREIIESGIDIFRMTSKGEADDCAVWFLNLTKCHQEIIDEVDSYDDIENYCVILEHLASESAIHNAFPPEEIFSMQNFFFAIWESIRQECAKDGMEIDFESFVFPETSKELQ